MTRARTIATWITMLALGVAATRLHGHLEQRHPKWRPGPNDWVFLPEPELFRATSLGFRQLAADLLWFRLVQAVGDIPTRGTGFKWLYEYADLVTDVDDRYPQAYFMAAHWLVSWEQPENAVRILDKGRVRFRGTGLAGYYKFPYYMGLYQFLFLRDKGRAIVYLKEAIQAKEQQTHVTWGAGTRLAESLEETGNLASVGDIIGSIFDEAESREEREALQPLLRHGLFFATVEQVNPIIARYRAEKGRLPASLEELVRDGYLAGVPRDPYYDPRDPRPQGFFIDPEGKLRSRLLPTYWWERGASGRKVL